MALAQLTEVRPQDETKALSWLTVSAAPAGEFAWPAGQGRPPREPAGGGSVWFHRSVWFFRELLCTLILGMHDKHIARGDSVPPSLFSVASCDRSNSDTHAPRI